MEGASGGLWSHLLLASVMGRSVLSTRTLYESMRVQVPPGCHAEMWPGLLRDSTCLLRDFLPPRWVCSGLGFLRVVISHPQPVNLFGSLLISLQDCVCCWSGSAHAGKCPSRGLSPWMGKHRTLTGSGRVPSVCVGPREEATLWWLCRGARAPARPKADVSEGLRVQFFKSR